MDDVIEELISEVRRRHKRSLWGNLLSWFSEEGSEGHKDDDDSTRRPTRRSGSSSYQRRSFRGPTTARPSTFPTGTQRPKEEVYRKIPVISPGLIQLRKGFWVGL